MPRPARQRRQYAPVRFGDPYNPRSVDGPRNAVVEAREEKLSRKMESERAAAGEAARPWHEKLLRYVMRRFRAADR